MRLVQYHNEINTKKFLTTKKVFNFNFRVKTVNVISLQMICAASNLWTFPLLSFCLLKVSKRKRFMKLRDLMTKVFLRYASYSQEIYLQAYKEFVATEIPKKKAFRKIQTPIIHKILHIPWPFCGFNEIFGQFWWCF